MNLFRCLPLLLCAPLASPAAEVAELHWLAGHWVAQQDSGWAEEVWLPPRDGLMLGLGRNGNGAGRTGFEFLRISADADGTLVYWAAPSGGTPVPFRAEHVVGQEAHFSNPDHDFPQRIVYRRDGDQLEATISTLDGGNPIRFEWRRSD